MDAARDRNSLDSKPILDAEDGREDPVDNRSSSAGHDTVEGLALTGALVAVDLDESETQLSDADDGDVVLSQLSYPQRAKQLEKVLAIEKRNK